MSTYANLFNELLYGSGAWLGILIILSLMVGVTAKIKEAGAVMVPIGVYLAIDYITKALYWNSIIMIFTVCFVVYVALKGS